MCEVKVYASVLGGDLAALRDEVVKVERAGVDALHVDVMDGHFVPNLTFGPPVIRAVKRYTKLPINVHLMVTNPWDYVKALSEIGVDEVTFHVEVTPHPIRLIREFRRAGMRAGVAISPATPEDHLRYLRDELELLLVMSVEPGFAGQRFLSFTYEKLRRIARIISEWERKPLILVDGGVNADTAPSLIREGVRGLVCASYIFNAENVEEAVRLLRERALMECEPQL